MNSLTVAHFEAFLAILFWGLSFVATKVALEEVSPLTVIVLRFGIGLIFLLCAIARRRAALMKGRDLGLVFLLGLFSVTIHQLLQVHALAYTSATNTAWLVALIPVFTALGARIFLGERFTPLRVGGTLTALCGALLVVSKGQPSFLGLPSTIGDLLALLSAANWAGCSVLGKGILRRRPALLVTTYSVAIGWLLLLPLAAYHRLWQQWGQLSTWGWGAIVFLGLGCSGVAYLAWYDALEAMEAARVAAFLYLEPLVTLLAASAILDETISWSTVVGGLIILLGLYMVNRPRQENKSQ